MGFSYFMEISFCEPGFRWVKGQVNKDSKAIHKSTKIPTISCGQSSNSDYVFLIILSEIEDDFLIHVFSLVL